MPLATFATLARYPLAVWLQGCWHRAARQPGRAAAALIFAGFAGYLLACPVSKFHYDSAYYWWRAEDYWASGSFELLGFSSVLRGYLFSLVLAPLWWLTAHYPALLAPQALVRLLNAGLAAAFFGAAAPGLWRATHGRHGPAAAAPVPLGRRLLLAGLVWVFWRGYFSFPLTDFPALLALVSGLWAACGPASGGRWLVRAALAGALAMAAANCRPVYLTALPIVGLLCARPRAAGAGWRGQMAAVAAFVAGVALVATPQAHLNQVHFGSGSPLVLTTRPGQPSLYVRQLAWGLRYQKYETNVGTDYPEASMYFHDPAGSRLLQSTGCDTLVAAADYLALARQAPAVVAGNWLGHLFNGLDVQYPMPYVEAVFVPTWGLALLNYAALLGGAAVLLHRAAARRWRSRTRPLLVLAALLLPCLAVLPTAVECRFLLPLHLLLCAALAYGWRPTWAWRAWRTGSAPRRALTLALSAALVAGAFACSVRAQAQLAERPRLIFEWPKRQPAPEPW